MATLTTPIIDYPTSDGKPMAETDTHRNLMIAVLQRLIDRYASDPDTYVSGNLLVYYEEGNPRVHLAPDVFVVFGVPKKNRPLYKTWEEGVFPAVVFEFTSKSTSLEDQQQKYSIYEQTWKVKEYFLFDPLGEYLSPRLQGYRLSKGKFRRLEPFDGKVVSQELGLVLEPDGEKLLLRDTATGELVLTSDEAATAAANERAAKEAAARQETEAELAKLKAELEALRRKVS